MSLSYEQMQAVTTCWICRETYNDPRSLPCTHTFCLTCISARSSHREIECPVCWRRFENPDEDDETSGFRKCFYMNRLIQLSSVKSASEDHKTRGIPFDLLPIDSMRGAVTRKLQVFSNVTAKTFAKKVFNCIELNNLNYAKMLMENIQRSDRAVVMRELSDDGCSPLFEAVRLGRKEFVEYFLDDCNAVIDQRGVWIDSSSGLSFIVTPLWLAAGNNCLCIVKFLVERGADVNAQTQTQTTVLRAASLNNCDGSHSDVIRYLIKSGADVNSPNVNGYTCLHDVTTSVELCQYLIQNGAKINEAAMNGLTALHNAIDRNNLDVVKLLIDHGADTKLRNEDGDDALRIAINFPRHEITAYLLRHVETDVMTLANAYALMGVQHMNFDEPDEALECWKLASLQLTRVDSGTTVKLLIYSRTVQCEQWKNIQLPTQSVDKEDFTQVQIQLCEVILGPCHKETVYALRRLARFYAVNNAFENAIDVCFDAVQRCRSRPHEHRPHAVLPSLELTSNIIATVHDEVTNVKFNAVSFVYSAIVDEFTDTMKLTHFRIDYQELLTLMEYSIYFLYYMLAVAEEPDDENRILELTRSLVSLQPRTFDGRSLLHVAISAVAALTEKTFHSDELDCRVVETLLKADMSVNLTDAKGNTALDYVFGTSSIPTDLSRRLRDLLLRYGAIGDFFSLSDTKY